MVWNFLRYLTDYLSSKEKIYDKQSHLPTKSLIEFVITPLSNKLSVRPANVKILSILRVCSIDPIPSIPE